LCNEPLEREDDLDHVAADLVGDGFRELARRACRNDVGTRRTPPAARGSSKITTAGPACDLRTCWIRWKIAIDRS
jgi:hypothetical protein